MTNQESAKTILVGEDELEVQAYLETALKCLGYSVDIAENGDEVIEYLKASTSGVSAVLLDILMPQRDGIETLREIRRIDPQLPVIMVSGAFSTNNVVAAMKSGACDFLCKPVSLEDLQKAFDNAFDSRPVSNPPQVRTANALKGKSFLGRSPRMQELQTLIPDIGWSDAPVLIQGETGTGKEVFARSLHANSQRANKVFLKLNCAALPSELVESELFGYERGAFTGAFQKRSGMFEMANGGTLLLDEIGDMDVRLQAKLLQVLQDHEFQRVGGKEVIKVDVRVLAATHRDLENAILEKTFREDLYYRLNVISVELPPLQDRKEDIVPLAEHLLHRHVTAGNVIPEITSELKQAMVAYHWPGNVRELENVVRKLIVLRDPGFMARELQAKTARKKLSSVSASYLGKAESTLAISSPEPILKQVTKAKQHAEAEAILAALDSTRWNRKQAAALLRIEYKALLYKLKKLGLEEKVPATHESGAPLLKVRSAGQAF
jgi:two-component system, NtrC family, response regulator AtoC